MAKTRYVRYLVGVIFFVPVYCIHVVDEDEPQKKPGDYPAPGKAACKGASKGSVRGPQKRTCGHAHKSVRMDHKK